MRPIFIIFLNQFILNGLVDMYAKCGDLTDARLIFEGMLERNDACWNAMILGVVTRKLWSSSIEW